MKKLVAGLFGLGLSACATTGGYPFKDEYTQLPIREFCGQVDTVLDVYVDSGNGFVDCAKALAVTKAAYNVLKSKAGPLREPWDVKYTYKYLEMVEYDFSTPSAMGLPGTIPTGPGPIETLAVTHPTAHQVFVREGNPRSILHELFHAYMHENGRTVDGKVVGSSEDHKAICQNHSWWTAEFEFSDMWPRYCYDNGGVK